MSEALLEAGLLPVGTASDGGDPIRPRAYRHPHLGGRPVVRLVGDTVAPGEDQALAFLGFDAPAVGDPVALGRPESLGYPAWALVHDPGNARAALDAVPDLERAARLARTKPGSALQRFETVEERLPVSHLPSFWEQAGRSFLSAGNAKQASAMFGRARQAEQMHALPVDEETRRAAYLEFAFAGALTVKAISSYADELSSRYEPQRVYAEFMELVTRRTLGGLAPWAELPRQLRRLATAAGLDPAAEQDRLIEQVLALPAARRLSAGLWKTWRAPLARLAANSPELRATLLTLFPEADDVRTWWLGFLDEIGALQPLITGAAPAGAPTPADWLTRAIDHVGGHLAKADVRAELLALVERMSPRLIADGVPVRLDVGNRYWARIDADLLDAALSHGVPVAVPRPKVMMDLHFWYHRGGTRRDLVALVADERFDDLLDQAVTGYAGRSALSDLLPVMALRPRIERIVAAEISKARCGGLLQVRHALNQLGSLAGPELFDAMPAQRRALEALDLTESLTRTLRAGVIDEFGWQALEEVVAELGGPQKLTMTAGWPVLTLCSRTKAIAVGPQGRIAEHDLKITSKVDGGPVAIYVGGVFHVQWWQQYQRSSYWSDAPSAVTTKQSWQGHQQAGLGFAMLTADGGLAANGCILRPGDDEVPDLADTLYDGATYWKKDSGGTPVFREFDHVTGELGRSSLPEFFESRPPADGEQWQPHVCSLARLPAAVDGSPLGHASGLVGFRVSASGSGLRRGFHLEGVDGRMARGTLAHSPHEMPWGLLRFPGSTEDRLVAGFSSVQLSDADGSVVHWRFEIGSQSQNQGGFGFHSQPASDRAAGTPLLPPPAFWHFLQARDEAGSRELRSLPETTARELLDAGAESQVLKDPQLLLDALPRLLPKITDQRLMTGVGQAVRQAVRIEAKRIRLLARKPTLPEPPRTDDAAAVAALHGLLDSRGGFAKDLILRQISLAGHFLTGGSDPKTISEQLPSGSYDWAQLIGRIAAVAVRAVSPATSDRDRDALTGFLEVWAASPFADPDARLRIGDVDATHTAVRDDQGAALTITEPQHHVVGMQKRRRFVELRTGEAAAPSLGPIADAQRPPTGWGDAARLRRLLELLNRNGPVRWDPEAAMALAGATGLNRPTAAMILAGFPGISRYGHGESSPMVAVREALGLKAKEASMALEQLARLQSHDRLEVLSSALPEDPAELWESDGLRRMAERVAQAWVGRYGQAVSVPESTLTAADKLPTRTTAVDLCALLAEPAADAALTADTGTYLVGGEHQLTLAPAPTAGRLAGVVTDLASGIAWAYAELPAGDPVRAGAAAALELVGRRLGHPEVLLEAGSFHAGDRTAQEVQTRFGPRVYRSKAALGVEVLDDGLTVASHNSYYAQLYFRPSAYTGDERSRLLESSLTWDLGTVAAVAQLRSEGYAAIAERIRSSGLPDGAYEADPAVSAPDLTTQVAQTLSLTPEAAALYLQLLTLLEPTDRNVRNWNGWTAARHTKARTALLDAGLVIEAKRARAGRAVFLPGGWMEAKAPNLPVESWKRSLYGLAVADGGRHLTGPLAKFLPMRPLPELFATAWQRVQDGDAPR